MSVSISVILALTVVSTPLTVLRLVEVRDLLSVEEALVITDKRSHAVFAFATHYFFSVMLLCISGTTTESSIFLDVSDDKLGKITRLVCFLGLVVATLFVFL